MVVAHERLGALAQQGEPRGGPCSGRRPATIERRGTGEPLASMRSAKSTSKPSTTPTCTCWRSTAWTSDMYGMAAAARPSAGAAREASSHSRVPTR
ncbi:MAG TPA: hypothetical protein DCL70_03300 [Kocuria sp.]|nr:hypothetical protein [Kocuria sp.]